VCSDDFDLARIAPRLIAVVLAVPIGAGIGTRLWSIYAESLGVKVRPSTTGRNIERRMRGEPELAK
jgi:hypothetical protein